MNDGSADRRPRSTDRRDKNNPSLGFGIWGPLVPASDCRPCIATLAVLQLGAGAYLCLRPRRRPPMGRGVWTNRLIKFGGFGVGTYLVFMAGIEFTRMALVYDPWVDDARRARKHYLELNQTGELELQGRRWFSPKALWFAWFGPPDYRALPWTEWRRRVMQPLEKAKNINSMVTQLAGLQQQLMTSNRATADRVLNQARRGSLPIPEVSVQELEYLDSIDELDGEHSDEEVYEVLDMRGDDMWDMLEVPQSFSAVILPRATLAFTWGVNVDSPGLKAQDVCYNPIPQLMKRQ